MRKIFVATAVALSFACLAPASSALAAPDSPPMVSGQGRGMHRLGLGANYWKSIDNIGEEFDRDGFSYIVSYQYSPPRLRFLKFGANLELFPDVDNADQSVLAPELFFTFGRFVYAGAGIGVYYHDGNWGNDPFYMLRAGFDIPVLPRLFVDLNINYRFNHWETLEWTDLGTDTINVGAAVRFVL